MAAQLQLPPELYEAIVDQLCDDPPSLKQCSLVCRRFAHRGQKHLFRRIVLDRPSKRFKQDIVSLFSPTDKFFDLINRSPHLCKLILELEISDRREMSFYREHNSWIRTDCSIARILLMLSDLEELIIWGNSSGSRLNFQSWKGELKSAILLKSRSLVKLSLSLVRNVPLLLLNDAPNLESLNLLNVRFAPDDFPAVHFPQKAKPTILDITAEGTDDWPSIYPWLQSAGCGIDMTHLTDVSLQIDTSNRDISPDQLHSISWLLCGCANSLRRLCLFYPDAAATPPFYDENYIDLGSMPSLESLAMTGYVWNRDHHTHAQNGLHWLINNLAKIGTHNMLKNVEIECLMDDFAENSQSGFESAGWEDFEKVIWDLARIAERAYVRLTVFDAVGSYTEDFLQERMSRLCLEGIVIVWNEDRLLALALA